MKNAPPALGPGGYVTRVTRTDTGSYSFSFCIYGNVGRRNTSTREKAEELYTIAKSGVVPEFQRPRLSEQQQTEVVAKYQQVDEKGDWIYSQSDLAKMHAVSLKRIDTLLRQKGITKRTRSEVNRVRANRPEDKQKTTAFLRTLHKNPTIMKQRTESLKKTLDAPEQRARLTRQSHKWREYLTTVLEAAKKKAAKVGRGRPQSAEENKQYFKVGEKVEQKLAAGMELTAARKSVAKAEGMNYGSVVNYHKQFRGRMTRHRNTGRISIPV